MTHLAAILTSEGERPVALLGSETLDLGRAFLVERIDAAPPRSVVDALEPGVLARIEELVLRVRACDDHHRLRLREWGVLRPFQAAALRPPLHPGLIVCSGHTYTDHVREMGGKAPAHPAGFIKSSHTVIGPAEPIVLPARHAECVDFEGEFAFVIGRRCHDVSEQEAMRCIAGYVLVNDVSARDWVDEARRTGDMFFNTLGKQFPTFCPLGPCIATCTEIPDPSAVRLTTRVNGELMQSASIGELSCTIPQLLSFWSRWYEFHPGDVITSGSPAGVGAARTPAVYLRAGDRVVVSASGVGELANPVERARGADT